MWGLSTQDLLYPLYALLLVYVTVACLAAALTRRWWSGIVASPLTILLSLVDSDALAVFRVASLLLGLPAAALTGLIFKQMVDQPTKLLGTSARIVALTIGGVTAGMAILFMRA